MIQRYERPAMEAICLQSLHHLTQASEIPIGGKGGFDVKRHYGDWEIDWNGTQSDEDDWEEGERIF